jgi:hypothetical protein
MEDASGVDLDWFWRGWFYTTDYTDIGIKEVKTFKVGNTPQATIDNIIKRNGMEAKDLPPLVYMIEEGSEEDKTDSKSNVIDNSTSLKAYVMDNFSPAERAKLKNPKYFYNVTFEKPGGLVMPIIVEYTYEDGSKQSETYPAQIWRLNDKEVSKAIASDKKIVSIQVDPNLETADVDTSNNTWPKKAEASEFDKMKNKK